MITTRNIRPYFLSDLIKVCTNLPFRQTLGRPNLSGQMVKWVVELGEYEIDFEPRTAIKAQALADFLQETTLIREKRECKAFVHGSVMKEGEIGVTILIPEGDDLRFAIHFKCSLSNNKAEYEAILNVVQMFLAMNAEDVMIFTDPQLVTQQVLGNFEVKEERVFQYINKIRKETLQLTSF